MFSTGLAIAAGGLVMFLSSFQGRVPFPRWRSVAVRAEFRRRYEKQLRRNGLGLLVIGVSLTVVGATIDYFAK